MPVTPQPAVWGENDSDRLDQPTDHVSHSHSPAYVSMDASGYITGLIAPNGTQVMQFVDVGGSDIGTTIGV